MEVESEAWYWRFMQRRNRPHFALVMALPCLAYALPARAQEQPSRIERVLWSGGSPGTPSPNKRTALVSLYSLGGLGVLATGYFAFTWLGSKRDAERLETSGSCYDLLDGKCQALLAVQADVRSGERLTALTAAGTTAAFLGAVLVAEYWDNVALEVDAGPSSVGLRMSGAF